MDSNHVSRLTWWFAPFVILLAIIHSWAFWGTFHVPFPQYMTVHQVLTSSATSLLIVALLCIVISAYLAVVEPQKSIDTILGVKPATRPKGMAEPIRAAVIIVLGLIGIGILAWALWNGRRIPLATLAGALMVVLVHYIGSRASYVRDYPQPRLRLGILSVFLMAPVLAWFVGKGTAADIWKGTQYSEITHSVQVDALLPTHTNHNLRLIGHLDSWLFVLACRSHGRCNVADATIIRISDASLPTVELTTVKEPFTLLRAFE